MRPAWLTTVSALLAGAAHAAPLTFAAAQKIADETAPSLQAKGADITAARSAAIAAGRLPDPKLGFAVEGFPVSGPYAGRPNRDDFSDLRFSVSQELPNVAKRRAARERAGAEIDVAEASKVVEARNVQVNTALAWIDLYYSVRRLKALDDIDHALAPLRKAGRAELASGVSRPAQTLEAEQLTAALGDRRAELTAEVGKARAELVRWTGDADVEVAGDPPDFRIDSAALRAGLDRIPTLAAYDAMSAQADADLSAAKADKRPDWGVELGYQRRDPTFGDMVMAGVTVSLPIFPGTRQDPVIAARAQTASRVRIEREATRRKLVADLDADLADHVMHHDRLARAATTLVPLAERRAELERASFAAGTASLSDVLQAFLAVAEAKLDALNREADATRDGARINLTYGSTEP